MDIEWSEIDSELAEWSDKVNRVPLNDGSYIVAEIIISS